MAASSTRVLLALVSAVLLIGLADAVKTCKGGTPDRPVYLLNLAKGKTFCLKMPRYLTNPATDTFGRIFYMRTQNDTCGTYGLVVHPFEAAGPKGPYPHLHYSALEYFIPLVNGTLRLFSQADTEPLKAYTAGKIPGVNGMPPVEPMGYVDVPGGSVGLGVKAVPHTWRVTEDITNFVVFFVDGWGMEQTINIPQSSSDPIDVLGRTSVWGTPFDLTNGMFGGDDYITRALAHKSGLPATTKKDMKLLQKIIEAGEACFPG
ncbi:hypothetical protein Rsub_05685 [Raphidocelis subcapitata]|uniref:Cupin type-1 domain-containing protein n=1 Tax=Raphidocelis subcapitata TaxID=307507 RepID=A0A2V0NZL8_9CHLO|nr:hypothetical protein Rsub_05685 [Raphidocelis subcapitata]|eukprot:GBF93074.1 hypothetical protein Rsub_05685 [Raphidocelis subcapitata]